jgi:hypothetical protein
MILDRLAYRTLRIDLVRLEDGRAVWRGAVRSGRRVVWLRESDLVGDVLASLVAWLEADEHASDCCCALCLARAEAEG